MSIFSIVCVICCLVSLYLKNFNLEINFFLNALGKKINEVNEVNKVPQIGLVLLYY